MLEVARPEVQDAIEALVREVDPGARIRQITALSAGGNNRAFRVQTSRRDFFAKQYFAHPADTRDRLSSEFEFLTYAERVGPGWTPRPFAKAVGAKVGLYEYVEGVPLTRPDVTAEAVHDAAAFFAVLNAGRCGPEAVKLPFGSEAAFSLAAHLERVGDRIGELIRIEPTLDEDREALALATQLQAVWPSLVETICRLAADWAIEMGAELEQSQRCVSPSDFGFHNALRRPDGRLCFLDFEYAGWDDPARMVGDFFAQVALPAPESQFESFASACLGLFPQAEMLHRRALLLRPVYLAKWCCIAMGVFLPVSMARRKFADRTIDERALKRRRVATAAAVLDKMRDVSNGLH